MGKGVKMQRRAAGQGLAAAALGFGLLEPKHLRAQDEGTVIRAIGTADLHGGTTATAERLRNGLERTSQERVRLQLEPNAASTQAVIESLRGGQATLGWVRVAEIAELAPEVAALSVPFLFRDPLKALGILDTTAIGPLLNDQLRKQDLEPLGYLDMGALRLAGTGPISLSALQGQRITARPGSLRAKAFEALGLELAPGVAQGASQGLAELRTDDLAALAGGQGARALVETPHAHDIVVVCANRARFGSLTPDVRELLRNQVQEVSVWERGGTVQVDASALQSLRQQGVEVTPLPPAEMAAAHDKVKAAMTEALRNGEPSIVRTVLAYAD